MPRRGFGPKGQESIAQGHVPQCQVPLQGFVTWRTRFPG
jgi:hypothetical protein